VCPESQDARRRTKFSRSCPHRIKVGAGLFGDIYSQVPCISVTVLLSGFLLVRSLIINALLRHCYLSVAGKVTFKVTCVCVYITGINCVDCYSAKAPSTSINQPANQQTNQPTNQPTRPSQPTHLTE
jgi:hypothetical protein